MYLKYQGSQYQVVEETLYGSDYWTVAIPYQAGTLFKRYLKKRYKTFADLEVAINMEGLD